MTDQQADDVIAEAGYWLTRARMGFSDRFEMDAEAFYRETGYMAPGKSVPLEMASTQPDEARKQAWSEWVQRKQDAFIAFLESVAALVSLVTRQKAELSLSEQETDVALHSLTTAVNELQEPRSRQQQDPGGAERYLCEMWNEVPLEIKAHVMSKGYSLDPVIATLRHLEAASVSHQQEAPNLSEALESAEAALLQRRNGLYPEERNAAVGVLNALSRLPEFAHLKRVVVPEESAADSRQQEQEQAERKAEDLGALGQSDMIRTTGSDAGNRPLMRPLVQVTGMMIRTDDPHFGE